MLRSLLLLSALVAVSQAAHAEKPEPDCLFSPVLMSNNTDVQATARFKSGKTCRTRHGAGRFQVNEIQILREPMHGVLQRDTKTSYVYVGNPGYTGPDSYHVRILGFDVDSRGNKMPDTYRGVVVHLNVIP
jgi:hypothetical protein